MLWGQTHLLLDGKPDGPYLYGSGYLVVVIYGEKRAEKKKNENSEIGSRSRPAPPCRLETGLDKKQSGNKIPLCRRRKSRFLG